MTVKTQQETAKLGPNVMTVMEANSRIIQNSPASIERKAGSFSMRDYHDVVNSSQAIVNAAPFILDNVRIEKGSTQIQASVVATTVQYPLVRVLPLAYGAFFSTIQEQQKIRVVVLGNAVARELFPNLDSAIGATVTINAIPFVVQGVVEELGQSPSGEQRDKHVYMPITTFMRRVVKRDTITGVYFSVLQNTDREYIKNVIVKILRKNHTIHENEEDDFIVLTAKETAQLQIKTLRLVRSIGYLVATLSFSIGGLGILSIMIVLVRIRRVEIGIRRAVGATYADIIKQFLYEAVCMSLVGGILGILLGCVVLFVVYALAPFPPLFSYTIIAGAITSSIAIGVLAGLYPALEGAKTTIVAVLKNTV